MTDFSVARRTLIGSGIGAGLVAGLAAARVPAAAAETAPAQETGQDIWSHEYWAQKGDVKLNLFRKRVGVPAAGASPLPVLFLVHGSSLSARSSYDLSVPGKGDYSMMDVFARAGFDV